MGQVWSDSTAAEVGRDYDSVVQGVEAPFKQAKNGVISSMISKPLSVIANAPFVTFGALVVAVGLACMGTKNALAKAVKMQQEINGDKTASLDEKSKTGTYHRAKHSTLNHFDEAYLFDSAATAEQVGRMAKEAGKAVEVSDKYLMCHKDDAACISKLCECKDVACCSLSDMKMLYTYLAAIKKEKERDRTEDGLRVNIDPAHFESLQGRTPEQVVEFLHGVGIDSAELCDDGTIKASADDFECFKMASEDNSLTATAMIGAIKRVGELQMGRVTELLGGHFKGKDDQKHEEQGHDESKESRWAEALEILAEPNTEKDDHDDHDDGGPELTL